MSFQRIHYLGKCPNSAQTKHTTGVRACLGPWQWNTCSLVLYVVSHVVSGVHKILVAIVWWERGGWVVGQVDVARWETLAPKGKFAMWVSRAPNKEGRTLGSHMTTSQNGSHVSNPKRKVMWLPKKETICQNMGTIPEKSWKILKKF